MVWFCQRQEMDFMETHLFSWTGDLRWFLITGIFETGGALTVISGSNFELEIEVLGRGILLVGVGILSNPLLVLVMSLSPGAHPYCSIVTTLSFFWKFKGFNIEHKSIKGAWCFWVSSLKWPTGWSLQIYRVKKNKNISFYIVWTRRQQDLCSSRRKYQLSAKLFVIFTPPPP